MSEAPVVQCLTEALRASEARLRAAIECLPFDFWMIGEDGTYVMQNSTCRELWGEVIGKRPQDLDVDPQTRAKWADNNRRALAGEVVRGEATYAISDGLRRFYNVVAPIIDDGKTIGVLGINLDITERKRAEQEVKQKNEELRHANEQLAALGRAKDRVTAMISHELRTPLVTGLGYIEMLLDGKLGPISDRVGSKMSTARKNLERLSQLIDRTLKYQRLLEMDRGALATAAPFELAAVVKETVDQFRSCGGAPPVRLEIEASLPQVLGDQELIQIVLTNLLNNVLAHAGPEATVRIGCRRGSEHDVEITVRDSGVGIPRAIRGTAFEPFVRGHSEKAGFGLGLSIVHAIIAAHRGTVRLESDEGAGTAVSFRLPLAG